MSNELMERARQAARVAQDAGAQDARVYASRSRQVRVEWRDGRLDRIRESTSQGLSITLYVDGRYSANGTSDIRPDAVEQYVRGAVETTRYLAQDEHRKLPPPERYAGRTEADLQLFDPALPEVTPEDRLTAARMLEEAARAGEGADRIISVTSTVGDYESQTACFATNGLEVEERGTYTSRSLVVSVRDEDDRKPRGSSYGSARFAADLPAIEELGADALRRALDQLGSRQVPTGKYELLIENRTVSTLLGHLLRPLYGSAVQQKRSCFEGRIGESIGSPALTIRDEPHLVRGLSSTAWDGEGMATVPREIFTEGVLQTYFLDTYYASKLGMEPTTGSTSNLVWTLGERDRQALVADVERGVLVTSFLGGNSNSTTGDFSMGIKGFAIEGGALTHPVSEVNIAGNHLSFWAQLAEVGNDPWPYSSELNPTLRFTDVQCSGSEA